MKMKWWMPLVAIPLGLMAVLGIASMAGTDVGARLHDAVGRFHDRVHRSSLQSDDGQHEIFVAWNDAGVQEAEVDGRPVPLDAVTLEDGLVRIRGVLDDEGWPLYEEFAFSTEAQLRTLPGDANERLGLRFAAAPDADGAWPVRPDGRSRITERGDTRTPAQRAGVQAGDALLEVDGTRPATREALRAALEARLGDEDLPLVVRRAGAEVALTLHPLPLTPANFWFYSLEDGTTRAPEPRTATAVQGSDTSR